MKEGLIILVCCVVAALLVIGGAFLFRKHPKDGEEVLNKLESGAKKVKDKAVAEYQEHIKS